jgi:hypothetical protein
MTDSANSALSRLVHLSGNFPVSAEVTETHSGKWTLSRAKMNESS